MDSLPPEQARDFASRLLARLEGEGVLDSGDIIPEEKEPAAMAIILEMWRAER